MIIGTLLLKIVWMKLVLVHYECRRLQRARQHYFLVTCGLVLYTWLREGSGKGFLLILKKERILGYRVGKIQILNGSKPSAPTITVKMNQASHLLSYVSWSLYYCYLWSAIHQRSYWVQNCRRIATFSCESECGVLWYTSNSWRTPVCTQIKFAISLLCTDQLP